MIRPRWQPIAVPGTDCWSRYQVGDRKVYHWGTSISHRGPSGGLCRHGRCRLLGSVPTAGDPDRGAQPCLPGRIWPRHSLPPRPLFHCQQLYMTSFGPYPFAGGEILSRSSSAGEEAWSTRPCPPWSGFLLMAHEPLHQWFGDKVRPVGWEDIWLNEDLLNFIWRDSNYEHGSVLQTDGLEAGKIDHASGPVRLADGWVNDTTSVCGSSAVGCPTPRGHAPAHMLHGEPRMMPFPGGGTTSMIRTMLYACMGRLRN